MIPLAKDTPLEVERIWLEGLRQRGPLLQLRRMVELSELCRRGAREAVRRVHPEAQPWEVDEIWLRETYRDADLAREVVARRRELGCYDPKP